MALINQHDEEEMFGLREAEVFSAPNSGSEEDYDDDVPEGERASKPTNPDDAADANAAKVIKPKRIVKNPQPKFDAARLCGPRGIGVVQKFLSNAPYRGKGYETEDLGILLQKLKHWAHRLYPKLPFADTIAQIEKLGNKKPVQVNVKRLRMDMYETPKEDAEAGEVVDDVERVGDNLVTAEDDEPDVFDELLRQSGASLSLQERVAQNSSSSQPSVPISQPVTLSAEVRERIERNRLLALERQRAKIASADTSSSSFLAKTTSNAGLSSPSTVSLGSGKRKRNIHDDSDDEAVQPTQEEVRRLRNNLLNAVTASQNCSTTNVETSPSGDGFDDEFDAMEIDAALDALEDAEPKDNGMSIKTSNENVSSNERNSLANENNPITDVNLTPCAHGNGASFDDDVALLGTNNASVDLHSSSCLDSNIDINRSQERSESAAADLNSESSDLISSVRSHDTVLDNCEPSAAEKQLYNTQSSDVILGDSAAFVDTDDADTNFSSEVNDLESSFSTQSNTLKPHATTNSQANPLNDSQKLDDPESTSNSLPSTVLLSEASLPGSNVGEENLSSNASVADNESQPTSEDIPELIARVHDSAMAENVISDDCDVSR